MFYAIFFLSGIAGLGYQMVWSKMFALGLGHEMPSVLAVVAAFFGGLALGAWLLDKPIGRSTQPGLWYVILELLIGAWGVLSIWLIPWCNELGFVLIGVNPSPLWHWTVAFALPFATLLPATLAMGATLPAMERFVSPRIADGRCVGGLYAANTAGAVAGTLASAFVIMPMIGFSRTVCVLSVINLICAVALWRMGARQTTTPPSNLPETSEVPLARVGRTVFLTGLLGIGYEVLGVRVMSQVLENTIYSFAAVLSVFLTGTALGAAIYQRFGRQRSFEATLGLLVWGISMACLLGIVCLSHAKVIYAFARTRMFGDGLYGVMVSEMVVAITVFALPTLVMGATFSHLVQAAKRRHGGVGWAAAINTLGGALAPPLFGVLLLPTTGTKWSLMIVSMGYLLLIPRTIFASCLKKTHLSTALLLIVPLVLLPYAWTCNLLVITKYANQKVISYREGVMAAVAVIQTDGKHHSLRVNNRFRMGSTDGALFECLQAQTPLLLHPQPKHALFLGLGTAITFRAAAFEPGLVADGVELVPELIDTLPYFTPMNLPRDFQSRQTIYVADARRFIRVTDRTYDVIIADLFHPGRDGAGSLYTREHFQAVRNRLKSDGLFCQWLPLFQMDQSTLKTITRTFLEVFPETHSILANFDIANPALGLVGTLQPTVYGPDWYPQRVQDDTLYRYLKGLLLQNGVRLFGTYVMGPDQLRRYTSDAPINTDDKPVVTFHAPRFTNRQDAKPYETLVTLLASDQSNLSELIDEGTVDTRPFTDRVAQFIAARNVYIHGLVDLAGNESQKGIDALIQSATMSVDFTAAYARCLSIARSQAKSDPTAAAALLRRLNKARPERHEAQKWLQELNTQ